MNNKSLLSLLFLINIVCHGQINLDKGLIAFYPFNKNANDSSSNAFHGKIYGASLSSDRFNKDSSAFLFDSPDDSIVVPLNEKFFPDTFTVCAWINLQSNNLSFYNILSNNYLGLELHATYPELIKIFKPRGFLQECGSTGRSTSYVYGDNAISLNQWYFLSFVYSGSTLKFYVDGTLRNTRTTHPSYLVPCQTTNLFIGATSKRIFDGKIDDIRLYSRILSDEEISALYSVITSNYIDTRKSNITLSKLANNDKLYLLSNIHDYKDLKMDIFHINGQNIKTINLESNDNNSLLLDFSYLPKGSYFIRIQDLFTGKIFIY